MFEVGIGFVWKFLIFEFWGCKRELGGFWDAWMFGHGDEMFGSLMQNSYRFDYGLAEGGAGCGVGVSYWGCGGRFVIFVVILICGLVGLGEAAGSCGVGDRGEIGFWRLGAGGMGWRRLRAIAGVWGVVRDRGFSKRGEAEVANEAREICLQVEWNGFGELLLRGLLG